MTILNAVMQCLIKKLKFFPRTTKKRVLIFGTGQAGQSAYRSIKSTVHVLGFVDNDAQKHGRKLFGKAIYSPKRLKSCDFDQILIASMYSGEIMVQLVNTLNVAPEKIRISSAHLQDQPGTLKRICPASIEYRIRKHRDPDFRRACYAAECYEKRPLRPRHILYELEACTNEHAEEAPGSEVESVLTQRFDHICNPHTLFQSLLDHPAYQQMVHVLAVRETTQNQLHSLQGHPRVRIVEIDSDDYIEYAQTCKYVITQRAFKPYIAKRKDQVFVTMWSNALHKRTDCGSGDLWDTKDAARSLVLSDHFVCPDAERARQLIHSLRIDHIFQGKVVVPQHADGDVERICRSVADLIITGIDNEGIVLHSDDRAERIKILMYPGALHPNGVTTGFIALLNAMDHEKHAVTVLLPHNDVGRDYQRLLHPQVNVLFNTEVFGCTLSEHRRKTALERRGLRCERDTPIAAYRRNMRRVLPDVVFDVAIDYHGYHPEPAATICFGADAGKRIIYMHNNLLRDMAIKHPQLHAVFSLYPHFDRILCVSADSLQENREGAGAYIRKQFGCDISAKMDFTHNLIDPDAIKKSAREKPVIQRGDSFIYRVENTINTGQNARYTFEIPAPLADHVNFITIGRLSPEKNHLRMIKAFRLLVEQHSHARLYLVGQGVMKDELGKAVQEYGLTEHVVFVYHMSNPFPLLDLCDCFLLSPDIEGQGIVILEALVLEKTVISTDIPGPHSTLKDGQGILVPPDAEALAKAMIDYIESGDSKPEPFDTAEYVRNAMCMYEQKVFKMT